ncbi:MmcQ/YjbR family DNA-binding protein [Marinilabilia rubra]|uniref:MmcQ-like protein n=1 Tax=Marinilabilia rubra TaxID=2162893 RepID=A0A2U2BB38_9BACT|nr:MmcQ/YjbR family DNA-binding protein [Marinilabilia rubra]PWE00276.1 MmcQ-like protein [Marinilabilia rubra]
MNIEELREYCLSLPGTSECLPFNETTLVFKVGKKMFALTDLEESLFVNLKCDPGKAIELREQHPAVKPGHHMHKKHWNTIHIDGSITDKLIHEWIRDSYDLVIKGMTRKEQEELANLFS